MTASSDSQHWALIHLPSRPVRKPAEKLHQLAQGGYGIIYITEKLAAELTHEIEKYQEQVTPAIIQIPGIAGNTGAGVAGVKKSVEQAVGSDIIFGS